MTHIFLLSVIKKYKKTFRNYESNKINSILVKYNIKNWVYQMDTN
jgi:hypothetical protein